LGITEPNELYLGQKDYQQCMVIKKMIELTGRQTSLRICDTVRERDGLAMSSRNMRLSPGQRTTATLIHKLLSEARRSLKPGDLRPFQEKALQELRNGGFKPDYFEFAHADSLQILQHWNGKDPLVAVVAAFLGDVRLIDNMILN
jgi:pantoate--beta-alanine ligase